MDQATRIEDVIAPLERIAADPGAYAARWKERTGRKVVGILPMNFPPEIVQAAGALPVLVQEDEAAITYGRNLLLEFYCGYTRSLVDQAATGKFGHLDGLFLVDHCVALLGAVDAIRFELPEMPVYLAQFPASMDEAATPPEVRARICELRDKLGQLCGTTITDDDIATSIAAYNRNRQLLRRVYELRRAGRAELTSRQMQALVKSAMVMEVEEHNEQLERLLTLLEGQAAEASGLVRLHLSGHFCHAPRPELLDMIESCGVVVVDDDLFTGYRYISTDVPEAADPVSALAQWYFDRNANVPCATRAQKDADWEDYLLRAVEASGAQGVIMLVPKFCEPHMLYYPELRKALRAQSVPHLLVETEHEGIALESLRTRVEALVEGIRMPSHRTETA